MKGSDGALTLGLNVCVKIGGTKEVKMMLLQSKLPMAFPVCIIGWVSDPKLIKVLHLSI